jgi:hypothetical protein
VSGHKRWMGTGEVLTNYQINRIMTR